jgi:YggT family protein
MPTNVAGALVYIVKAVTTIYLFILLLRIWLPMLRADFRNPIAQAILKFTSPLVVPVRRFVPSIGRLDTATLLIAIAVQCLALLLTLFILGIPVGIPDAATAATFIYKALIMLLVHSISLFLYAIFIRIIISWVARGQYSPVSSLVATLSDPVLRPIQRLLPPLGGFDLSPIVAIIGLQALAIIVGGFAA